MKWGWKKKRRLKCLRLARVAAHAKCWIAPTTRPKINIHLSLSHHHHSLPHTQTLKHGRHITHNRRQRSSVSTLLSHSPCSTALPAHELTTRAPRTTHSDLLRQLTEGCTDPTDELERFEAMMAKLDAAGERKRKAQEMQQKEIEGESCCLRPATDLSTGA